ncbi:MAG: prepilin-type N-terminal cleavage/methylation domain-containing protein [Bdellovibrionales bacterium]
MRVKSAGFTLIEIMVVVAIIAGVVALSMPYLSNKNNRSKKFLREFTVLSRELHTKAKLQGAIFRLVIDLGQPDGSGRKPVQKYWVERSNGKMVLSEKDEEEALERLSESDPEKRNKDPKGYEMDTSMIKEPAELPPDMTFDKIEITRLKSPMTVGRAFIHYLPQGLTDEAAIHLVGDRGQTWTIAIHPLTGKAELMMKTVSLKEISDQ